MNIREYDVIQDVQGSTTYTLEDRLIRPTMYLRGNPVRAAYTQTAIEDKEKPKLTVNELPKAVSTAVYSITGTINEPAMLKVNGNPAIVNPINLSFTFDAALQEGDNILHITATDCAGNTADPITLHLIRDSSILESGIYRARQVGERVHIERSLTAGLDDYDAGGDGWALVGRTNGAGENGELVAFYVQDETPYAVLKAYTVQLGWHYRLITPPYLTKVTKGQTRITPVLQRFNLDAGVQLEQALRQQLEIDPRVDLIIRN